jgi:hypothetical protein
VVGRVVKVEMTFYSSEGWKSAGGGDANSILRFRLKRGGDWMKHWPKNEETRRGRFSGYK